MQTMAFRDIGETQLRWHELLSRELAEFDGTVDSRADDLGVMLGRCSALVSVVWFCSSRRTATEPNIDTS
ncbi:hypothetical protein O9929_15490 [Vibrio lentus]|nr:hypothetical protein [Vibrio lentus]